jgi:hypothetical protein
MSEIPTWKEYEIKCGFPQAESDYKRYLRENFKDELQENDNSEGE